MARILRRRVVKPTLATKRDKVSPQEINQWLQLGLSTAKIAEALGDVVPPVLYGGEKGQVGEEDVVADLKASRVFEPPSPERQMVRGRLGIPPAGTEPPLTPPPQPSAVSEDGAAPARGPTPDEVEAAAERAQWEEGDRVRDIVVASDTIKKLNDAARRATTFEEGEALIRRLDEVLETDGVLEFFGFGMGAKRDKAYGVLLKNLKRGSSQKQALGWAKLATRLKVSAEATDRGIASRTHEEGMVTKREGALKRKEGRKLKTVTAEEKRGADEYNRRKKAEGVEWDRRRKVYNKHQRRLVRLRGKVQSEKKKGKRVPSGYGATITKAADKISRYVGSVDELLLLRSKPAFLAALAAKTEDESVSLFGEEELAWKQAEAQEAIATRLFGEMEALKASVNTIGGADFSIEFDEVEGVPSLGLTDDDVDAEAGKIIDAIRPPQ
jgi:hypothetical protein